MESIERLPAETLKAVGKSWGAKSASLIQKKMSDPKETLSRFAVLTAEQKKIVFLLLRAKGEMTTASIAEALHYPQKKLSDLYALTDSLAEAGVIYIKRKRGRLSKNEDKAIVFAPIMRVLSAHAYASTSEMLNAQVDRVFDKTVYQRYEGELKKLYELGGHLAYRAAGMPIEPKALLALFKANALAIGVTEGAKTEAHFFIANIRVKKEFDKKEKAIADAIRFRRNFANIINDIERFLYLIEETRVRMLKTGAIDRKAFGKRELLILTPSITIDDLFRFSQTLGLVRLNDVSELEVNDERFSLWLKEPLETKLFRVENEIFEKALDDMRAVLAILKGASAPLTLEKLTSLFNRSSRVKHRIEKTERLVDALYILGNAELGFDDKDRRVMTRIPEEDETGRLVVNSNFEAVVMNKGHFDERFLYLLATYADMQEDDAIASYVFNEDTIVRGKYLSGDLDELIGGVKYYLGKENTALPKNIEITLRRWHDRIPNAVVYENAVLLELDNDQRLEEIAFIANKENIAITKVSKHYAIIKGKNLSHRRLARLFRKEKINIHFSPFADTTTE